MSKSKTILIRTKYIWQALNYTESLCYGLGISLFLYSLTPSGIAVFSGLLTTSLFLFLLKPWKISLEHVVQLIDRKYSYAEFSTRLLLNRSDSLPLIAKIQKKKIIDKLSDLKWVLPPNNLSKAIFFFILMALAGVGIKHILPQHEPEQVATKPLELTEENQVASKDSLQVPAIQSASVTIYSPSYTNIRSKRYQELNVKAVEKSWLSWSVTTNDVVKAVYLETSQGQVREMELSNGQFKIGARLLEDGFYNFKLISVDSSEHTSGLYQLEVVRDNEPEIEVVGISQYTTFNYSDLQQINFKTIIKDDFGITDSYIIATVSKGTGESVKFREERLPFDNRAVREARQLDLNKTIDLKKMKMTPGDELYFYIEAIDNRNPKPQKSRTQTYFLSIRDTTEIEFSLAGSLGVDLMPEYFRSQRQIIIDTEKLIAEQPQMARQDFNFTSNELGFDQKALRLKYGQFMGVEDESGIAIETDEVTEEVEESTQDPLGEYTHDHDGDNDHNLVAENPSEAGEDDPLHAYTHDHDDPEEATLYTVSVRSMLKQAMSEMWDAELYLRLYQPEKSLPYQYKALGLIKKIKNHARIYVHRIGFDPPPIKEDKRLTGEINEVKPSSHSKSSHEIDDYKSIKKVVARIESLLIDSVLTDEDYQLFEQAGTELAPLAIVQPSKYLKTLELLKKLSGGEVPENQLVNSLRALSVKLKAVIPLDKNDPINTRSAGNRLSDLYFLNLTKAVDE